MALLKRRWRSVADSVRVSRHRASLCALDHFSLARTPALSVAKFALKGPEEHP
jgi:hypothetical protein